LFIYLSKHKTLRQLPALKRTVEKLFHRLSFMSILEISGYSTSRCFLKILKTTIITLLTVISFLMIVDGRTYKLKDKVIKTMVLAKMPT
jgi:hypothetical protein